MRIISWFAMFVFLLEYRTQFAWCLGTVELLFTPPCVSFRAKKNGRRKADLSPAAAIYAALTEAVQPPDDRTYSAEVTSFSSNLLHHRSARAEFPYTRSIMLPRFSLFVKGKFRENNKNSK